MRLERSGKGPEKLFCLRLRTRRRVREARGWSEPRRWKDSRTSRVTRFWRQETPDQEVQGSVEGFHVLRLLSWSEEDLKERRGWVSGFGEACRREKGRRRREKRK